MKQKISALLTIILVTPILAGIYGVLHDQLTYTISPEYYTKFKFYRFGLAEDGGVYRYSERLGAALVGFSATWWTGIPIGIILGLTGMIHKDWITMSKITAKSLTLVLIISIASGLSGLLIGKFFLANSDFPWNFPENILDKNNFIAVGSMHNFSYAGGLFGLISGIIFSCLNKNKHKKTNNNIL
ncbi:hypothetical protein JXL83_04915 [candidate division WOR-3 bacterium]|nr:hypothetical protein [candidate division WOR-3 bacterium]